ncbi:CGNR zinc finger domain-containing protein [Streptomyces xantholiticus]
MTSTSVASACRAAFARASRSTARRWSAMACGTRVSSNPVIHSAGAKPNTSDARFDSATRRERSPVSSGRPRCCNP